MIASVVAGAHRVADPLAHLAHPTGKLRRDVGGALGIGAHLAGQLDAAVDQAGSGGGDAHAEAGEVRHGERRRRRLSVLVSVFVGARGGAEQRDEDQDRASAPHGITSPGSALPSTVPPTKRVSSAAVW